MLYAGSIAAGLLLWEAIAGRFSVFVLAPPSAVAIHLWRMCVSLELPRLVAASLGHMVVGFALGILVALPLGFLMGRVRVVHDKLQPLVTIFYAVPAVAFAPFIIVVFGLYFEARVVLVFIMCVFDMLIVVDAGARDVDRGVINVGRSFGAGWWQRTWLILLPASLPFVFTALRIGGIRAVNGMITAELFFAAVNLGAYMNGAAARFDSAGILSVLVTLCILGLLLQEAMRAAERAALSWTPRN
jgi:NitT/TauT family transport system permease protein